MRGQNIGTVFLSIVGLLFISQLTVIVGIEYTIHLITVLLLILILQFIKDA